MSGERYDYPNREALGLEPPWVEGQGGGQSTEASWTDAAKAKADDLGVDIATVKGTGSGGRVTVADVEAAAG